MTSQVMAFGTAMAIMRSVSRVGALLREWRSVRRLSQLDLALEAGTSSRHLSCVETGKAQPSREMVARLADTLGMPLRERNTLLLAAGYAPEYSETALTTTELGPMREAIDLILRHQEPYPAFVFNRHMDILMTNEAARRMNEFLCGGSKHANMLHAFFDPNDLRAVVVNWEEVAGNLIRHLHEELATMPSDPKGRALLDEVLRYPEVPAEFRTPETALPPLLTVVFRKDGRTIRFFSTFTRFGTPRDITLDELRIECTFPADEATAELCRALAT